MYFDSIICITLTEQVVCLKRHITSEFRSSELSVTFVRHVGAVLTSSIKSLDYDRSVYMQKVCIYMHISFYYSAMTIGFCPSGFKLT